MTDANNTLDSICGAALGMGFSKSKTVVIEFTGTAARETKRTYSPTSSALSTATPSSGSSKPTFEPSRAAIESRLELIGRDEYVLPVEGRYWSSLGDYFAGKEPTKCEIGREKATELGLYDPSASVIRIYKDSFTFPRQEEKEE